MDVTSPTNRYARAPQPVAWSACRVFRAFSEPATPTADDVARHAAYVAQLVGVEHAGIGLDISFHQDGIDDTPPGNFDATYWWPKSAGYDRSISRMTYTPVETWQVLASALQRSGMTGDEAALVMGGNMLRVARQVWR